MIFVFKDISQVPTVLAKREKDFTTSISKMKYTGDSYKVVKDELIKIYHDKCAYCETILKNNLRAVEHYRPKNSANLKKCDASFGYYWLALSWSNLLLSCTYCNSNKNSCFDTDNQSNRVSYNNEKFEKIHQLTVKYNEQEKPLLIHPEIDNPEKFICFDHKGEVSSKNKRMSKTIEICKLNRDDLIDLRMTILNEFRKKLKTSFNAFEASKTRNLVFFQAEIEDFFCKANSNKSSFTAWRRYILKHYKQFLFKDDNERFNTIIELALFKYRVSYCEIHPEISGQANYKKN